MDDIVTVACALLLAALVGVFYYSLRVVHIMRKENNRLMSERDEVELDAEKLCSIYERFMEDDKQEIAELFLYLGEAVEDFLCLDRYIDASLKCMVADDLIADMKIAKANFHELEKWVQEKKRKKAALQVSRKIT